MSKKQAYHHGDLRAELMRSALTLIEEHGVKGLALSDAARLSGVSVAAPYRHFKDKEALLAELAVEGFTLFRDALARAKNSFPTDKGKALVEMGVAYVEFALQHPSHFKVMWEGAIPRDRYPHLEQAPAEAFHLLQQAVIEMAPEATPARQQVCITAAWSIAHGYAGLALGGDLEMAGGQAVNKKLLRQTLHLLVDQFQA